MSANSETSPARKAVAVTPHDSTNISGGAARSLWVGGAGDVVVVFPDSSTATFSAVPAGTLLPVYCKRVNATSTTATLILALY